MKILITTDTYLPDVGGAEVHVAELVRQLRSLGHEVRLFTTQPGTVPNEEGVTRVLWHRNFFEVYKKLFVLTREFSPDVIAAHYSYRLAMITGLVAWVRSVPMTTTLHGLGTLPEAGAAWRPRLQNWSYRRLSLFFSAHVIATSQDMLDAVPYVTAKTTVISNGADAQKFDPEKIKNTPEFISQKNNFAGRKILLTVRRLNPKCGIQYLIEAMPEIVARHPEVLYIMVGKGRLENEIRARITELNLEQNIKMIGLIPNQDTPLYFALADMVIFPSTAESTSISCIEAMLMGKPIVASRVGGLIELLGREQQRGRLVKLVDWEASDYDAPAVAALPKERFTALAQAVCDLIENPVECENLGRAARTHALANYDWKIITARTLEIYKKIIKIKHN